MINARYSDVKFAAVYCASQHSCASLWPADPSLLWQPQSICERAGKHSPLKHAEICWNLEAMSLISSNIIQYHLDLPTLTHVSIIVASSRAPTACCMAGSASRVKGMFASACKNVRHIHWLWIKIGDSVRSWGDRALCCLCVFGVQHGKHATGGPL
jgi:hypothetical protein